MSAFRLPVIPSTVIFIIFILCSYLLLYNVFQKFDVPSQHLFFLNPGYRLVPVEKTHHGLIMTEQSLTRVRGNKSNFSFIPIESTGDDLGIYFTIPMIAKHSGLTVMEVYYVLSVSLIIIGFICTVTGITLLSGKNSIHITSFFILGVLSLGLMYILDVYCSVYLALSLIPLCLGIEYKIKGNYQTIKLIILYTCVGLVLGVCEWFRVYSAYGTLIFLIILKLFNPRLFKRKQSIIVLSILILISTQVHKSGMKYIQFKRDQYFSKHAFIPYVSVPNPNNNRHLFWHSMFIGLSYIKDNPYGIKWDDRTAFGKAKAQNITANSMIISDKYENFMKDEYFEILKNDPCFVIKTYAQKGLHVLIWLVAALNIGLFRLVTDKPIFKKYIPFYPAILFYCLPGILVRPFAMYILGAIILCGILHVFIIEKISLNPVP